MDSRFGSIKLIFYFLIFLIFLLFCILNIFFYDIYKKDSLLILSDYEKTMQHDHGEITKFHSKNIGELFFIRENIKERSPRKIYLNEITLSEKNIYGGFLKKYPYTIVTEENFTFDQNTKAEIETILNAFEILEFRNEAIVNQHVYVSNSNFLIIYPQYHQEKEYVFYLKDLFKKLSDIKKYSIFQNEVLPIEILPLEYNSKKDSLNSILFSRIVKNNKYLGNLYLSTALVQIENILSKDNYSMDFIFFTEEKEVFYSNKFDIRRNQNINQILIENMNKNLKEILNEKNDNFIPLIYNSDKITYLRLVSKDIFIELKFRILKIALLINSIMFIGIFCFIYLIRKYLKEDVKAIDLMDYQNTVDDLTKLLNRKTILKILSENFNNPEIYLGLIDIDKFKNINDTYGHPFGDFVLIKIAKLLKVIVGDKGYVARYGGEEFIIVFIGKDFELVKTVCDRINRIIFEKGKYIIGKTISVSIGLGKKQSDKNYATLLERADKNLYEAKNTGRNKVIYK